MLPDHHCAAHGSWYPEYLSHGCLLDESGNVPRGRHSLGRSQNTRLRRKIVVILWHPWHFARLSSRHTSHLIAAAPDGSISYEHRSIAYIFTADTTSTRRSRPTTTSYRLALGKSCNRLVRIPYGSVESLYTTSPTQQSTSPRAHTS